MNNRLSDTQIPVVASLANEMVMHATARCQNTNKGAKLGLAEVPCEEGLEDAVDVVI